MYDTPVFRPDDASRMHELARRQPFAIVVSRDGERTLATPLPLVMEHAGDGSVRFRGHFSLHNPQVAALRRDGRVLILFLGEHGYVSSSWLRDRRYAPTWNYELAQFEADLRFDTAPDAAREALAALVGQMEAPSRHPWKIDESPRLAQLSRFIAPFTATVTAASAQFKLGQGDGADVLDDSLRGLLAHGNAGLAAAMARQHGLDLDAYR